MEALHPFVPQPWLAGTELKAAAQMLQGRLELIFSLHTQAQTVVRPQPCAQIERRDELWQSTCFEAFFAEPGQERYWEINLAPNGHWNVYRFDRYRQGLRPEPLVSGLTYALRQSAAELQLRFSLNLQPLIAESSGLECSLTAVLDHPQHGCSFWALNHSGDQADFHRRDSFRPLLAAQG
jgi:hypothetical protein